MARALRCAGDRSAAEYGNDWRLDFPACQGFSTIYLNGTKFFEDQPKDGFANVHRGVVAKNLVP